MIFDEARYTFIAFSLLSVPCSLLSALTSCSEIKPDSYSRIHFETSSMLLRQLPVDRLKRPQGWNYAPSNDEIPNNEMRLIPGGVVHLGKSKDDFTYGWDSEYGDRTVEVKPFLASKYLITNGEFLEYEAIAFCRWKGSEIRLMSEAEWNQALLTSDANRLSTNYNLNLQFISPSPVGMFKLANSACGLYDLRGNVWEWLGDTFNPLPG